MFESPDKIMMVCQCTKIRIKWGRKVRIAKMPLIKGAIRGPGITLDCHNKSLFEY
jgi:hypothetical protein